MGVINPENTLHFRKTTELFARVKERLSTFDANNFIDEGKFYTDVAYILNQLGAAVYKECEALIEVKDDRAKLPCNFKLWYAAFKCHRNLEGQTKSINYQDNFGQPWIYFQDKEVTDICPQNCCINCEGTGEKTRIVVRTYVNGDDNVFHFHHPMPLILSPNVKDHCAPHCMKVIHAGWNEVTIADGYIRTKFNDDCIYMQYYGLPIDNDYLPMIPDEESIEKAIEYYIYKMMFEEWFLNSSVPNILQQLQYVSAEYEKYFAQARYYCKLPSFQRMVQSLRIMRKNLKFYNMNFDKTVAGYEDWGGAANNGWGLGFRRF